MQLSKFSDYALRILVQLASSQDRLFSTREIAELHDAKYNHLAKVTQRLANEGYIISVRGRSGGIKLAIPAREIQIGTVIRNFENHTSVIECKNFDGSMCKFSPACGLKRLLNKAQDAFFAVLDECTLEDAINDHPNMRHLLRQLLPQSAPEFAQSINK